MKTKEQFLKQHLSTERLTPAQWAGILAAMDAYSEQNCDAIQRLFMRPAEKLKPMEDLYRKEHPKPDKGFYLPDTTKFYEWIVKKILNQEPSGV